MKKISTVLAIFACFMSLQAIASANLTISQVKLDKKGNTLATTCVNTKGFYFEIGKASLAEHLTIYGFGGEMPLKTVVKDLLFPGWKVTYGKSVNTKKKIRWSGHKVWTNWLRQLAFENNLAIILDWQNSNIYINRL